MNSTSTEGVAVLATGKAENGAPLATTELYGFATLKTDKDDYAPGMFVTIIGSGWQPGEIVQMVLHETGPGAEPDLPLLATADEAGRIFNDIFAPNEGDLGRRFYLTAVGAGATAQTTFTDGNGTVTGTVRSSAPGNPVIAGATVNCISGCNGPSTATTNASGVYTFSANFPGNGPAPLQLTASKTGFNPATDSTSIPSNGATVTLNFTLSPVLTNTTTALVSSATPSVFGQNVTFTATVAPVPPGSGTPIGTVTFRDGATTLGTGSLAAGQATFTTSALSVGNHTITAEYGGNAASTRAHPRG